MNLVLSVTVAIMFGSGVYLMLKRDLIRVVIGINLVSNASILFIIAVSLFRGGAPIYPPSSQEQISDPLAQALALTAIVISFGMLALALALVYRVYTSHKSLDQADLQQAEQDDLAAIERETEALWR